jgi:16S rRNA (guanine527-N7)-methyltransferase
MEMARISALLRPFLEKEEPLSPLQLEQVSIYIDMLLRWNARINLTALRSPEEIVIRHFGESFFLARHLFPRKHKRKEESTRKGRRVLDIGSGAGFPGLPLEIWNQEMNLTMIESNHKKATFLREVVRTLGLDNVVVRTERAEELGSDLGFLRSDFVTFRAVENFEKILNLAVTFLVPGGRLAALIGASQSGVLKEMSRVRWGEHILVPQSHSRILAIGVSLG